MRKYWACAICKETAQSSIESSSFFFLLLNVPPLLKNTKLYASAGLETALVWFPSNCSTYMITRDDWLVEFMQLTMHPPLTYTCI